jgi:flagellar hook-associated protein 2
MTSSVNNSSSVMRTYGLSGSGMDVDAMVEKLMTAARQPYSKLTQQQTLLGWKKEAYNTMYTSINSFRNDKVFNFQMKSTLNAKTVTSTNSSVASVTASGDAINMNHTIKVTQLASGVTQTSTSKITTGSSKSNLTNQFGVSGSFAIKINGKEIAVNSSKSINDLVNDINKAGAGVTASYDATQDRFFLYTTGTGASTTIDFTGSSTQGLNFLTNNLKLSAVTSVSSNGITSGAAVGFDPAASLQSQFLGSAQKFNLKLSVGGATANIAIDTSKTSLNDIVNQINNIKDGNGNQLASASIDNTGKLTIKATTAAPISLAGSDAAATDYLKNKFNLPAATIDAGTIDNTGVTSSTGFGFDQTVKLSSAFQYLSGTFNLKISDGTSTKTISVNAETDTMETLLNKLNTLTDDNGNRMAVASFENGKFTLKSYSNDKNLDLSGSDTMGMTFLTQRLNLTKQQGQDAQVTIDGTTMSQSTNKFSVSGVTYNVQSLGTTTVSVQNDVDKIIASVKTFINDYNTLLSSINTKVSEKRDTNYMPLTDDQKKAMSEDDIKLWEDKTKTGLLHNDSILKTLSDSMRDVFSSAVGGLTGKYKTASSIGISTGVDWSENGKLYVDEDKLRAALQDDPDVVYKIFGTTSDTASNNGIAVKLTSLLKTAADKITDEAGTTASATDDVTSILGKQNKELTERMTTLNNKLVKQENQYYSQFNAMEEALSKLSQQSNYLVSLLGNNS